MEYEILGDGIKVINMEKSTKKQIKKHFFQAGYGYALVHFDMAVKELKIESALEKKIRKYLDFLDT